jgi:ribosomal protein S12 methylthiotransferase accessory factor
VPDDDPAIGFQFIVRCLEDRHISVHILELTRPELGVPAVRVLAPALQLDPCEIVSGRLAQTVRETGGGRVDSGAMAIL